MTAVIGFRYAEGIILGADSEQTVGDTLKLSSAKIFPINDADVNAEYRLMFAGAGDVAHMKMAVEKVAAVIEGIPKDTIAIRGLIESTILDIYTKHVWPTPQEPIPYFGFLVALWTRSHGILLFRSSSTAVTTVDKYDSIGTGGYLANYMIDTLSKEQMRREEAVLLAVHVLKQVKRYVPYCGGESQIIVLESNGTLSTVTYEEILTKELYIPFIEHSIRPFFYAAHDITISEEKLEESFKKLSENINMFRQMQRALSKNQQHPRYGDMRPLIESILLGTLSVFDKKGN